MPSADAIDSVPSFGGAFIKDGALSVYLVDLRDTVTIKRVMQRRLDRQKRSLAFRFIQGRFSYCQLYGYLIKIRGVEDWAIGVTATGIDERANQLFIGVIDEQSRERIRRLVAELQIQDGAVRVELFHVQVTD